MHARVASILLLTVGLVVDRWIVSTQGGNIFSALLLFFVYPGIAAFVATVLEKKEKYAMGMWTPIYVAGMMPIYGLLTDPKMREGSEGAMMSLILVALVSGAAAIIPCAIATFVGVRASRENREQ